jgi:hypothetical protein
MVVLGHSAVEAAGRIVIGHTTDRSVRIWAQGSRRYPRVRVSMQPAGQRQAGRVSLQIGALPEHHDYTRCFDFVDLVPSSAYEVTASFTCRGGDSRSRTVSGVFRTFPGSDTSKPFSFLLGSCNLPVVTINNLAAQALQVVGFYLAKQSLQRPIPDRRPESEPGEWLLKTFCRSLMHQQWARFLLRYVILGSLWLVFQGTGGKWSKQPLLRSPFLKLVGMFAGQRVDFQGGRLASPVIGETLVGLESRASGVVAFDPVVSDGTWQGGDAQGYVILTDTSGEFRAGEGLSRDGETQISDSGVIARVQTSSGFDMPDIPKPAFTIHAGDVIYYDFPNGSRRPQLDGYREAYRESWFEDRFQRWFLAQGPQYMTLDDHEIVDQFACDELGGSDDANRPTPRQYLEAALPAYMEYVHSRHPDGSFFYDFHHGAAQFFVMDTRTGRRRRSDSQMIDDVQMKGFKSWLTRHKNDLKFVVSSVPFVAELTPAADSMEADDKWCGRTFRWQRDEIIDFIKREGIEHVVFLVGDMHCAYHASMSIGTGHRWLRQTIHELAGGPINQLDLSERTQFIEASLITRGRTPYQIRMHQFHGNASAVMHIQVTNTPDPHDPHTVVPEIVWRVIRTMTDPETRRESNRRMRIVDAPPISGRITFCKRRSLDGLPTW